MSAAISPSVHSDESLLTVASRLQLGSETHKLVKYQYSTAHTSLQIVVDTLSSSHLQESSDVCFIALQLTTAAK